MLETAQKHYPLLYNQPLTPANRFWCSATPKIPERANFPSGNLKKKLFTAAYLEIIVSWTAHVEDRQLLF